MVTGDSNEAAEAASYGAVLSGNYQPAAAKALCTAVGMCSICFGLQAEPHGLKTCHNGRHSQGMGTHSHHDVELSGQCIFGPELNLHPGGYRVLELTAGLVVISIAFTPDLRD